MKKRVRRFIHASILIGTVIACARYLIVNEHGLLTYWKLKQEIVEKEAIIKRLEEEIIQLNASINTLENDSFEKERIAREDLQLGHKDEIVYFIHEKNF